MPAILGDNCAIVFQTIVAAKEKNSLKKRRSQWPLVMQMSARRQHRQR